ncbi:hypothetical protein CPB85DRAFT_1451821 [Mucidula mucida]|nr:hypothetical protein CPB85DRAFT_1451821 [Mucidula mucida]
MSAVYKRVALVTGSNTGIGLEIVRSLAKKATPSTFPRATSRLVWTRSPSSKPTLDVSSTESVAAAKDVIEKAEGRLDTVVHNAAISCMAESAGPLKESLANIQATFDTNLLGLIRVAQAFVPFSVVATDMASNAHMASPKGRLHQTISYNTSKVAANSYIIALAKELEGEVKVNTVTPGFTTTKLNGFAPGGRTPRQSADIIVPWALLGPEDKDKTCRFWGSDGELAW